MRAALSGKAIALAQAAGIHLRGHWRSFDQDVAAGIFTGSREGFVI